MYFSSDRTTDPILIWETCSVRIMLFHGIKFFLLFFVLFPFLTIPLLCCWVFRFYFDYSSIVYIDLYLTSLKWNRNIYKGLCCKCLYVKMSAIRFFFLFCLCMKKYLYKQMTKTYLLG